LNQQQIDQSLAHKLGDVQEVNGMSEFTFVSLEIGLKNIREICCLKSGYLTKEGFFFFFFSFFSFFSFDFIIYFNICILFI